MYSCGLLLRPVHACAGSSAVARHCRASGRGLTRGGGAHTPHQHDIFSQQPSPAGNICQLSLVDQAANLLPAYIPDNKSCKGYASPVSVALMAVLLHAGCKGERKAQLDRCADRHCCRRGACRHLAVAAEAFRAHGVVRAHDAERPVHPHTLWQCW